jgi:putative ABC transport system permease protein
VRAAGETLASRWRQAYPDTNRGREIRVLRSQDVHVNAEGDRAVVPAAAVLLAAVGLVLLAACANVSGLMLARASGLRREAAVRLSLGAGRGRLLARGLAESALLSVLGGACGLGVASALARALVAYRPPLPVPFSPDLHVDWRVAAFTAAATLGTALVLGVLPWWQVSRQDPAAAFRGQPEGGRRSAWGLRNLLLLPQVALSLVLLVVAALFARSLANGASVEVGFDGRSTALLALNLGMSGYDESRGAAFYAELTARLRGLPGVRAVALAGRVPLDLYGNQSAPLAIDASGGGREETVQTARVGEDYFEALRIPILRGRAIGPGDLAGPPVAVVSAEAARRYWPGENALGRRIRLGDASPWREVVGIAADVKVQTLGEAPQPLVYEPLAGGHTGLLRVVVSRDGDPALVLGELRRQVAALDPAVAVFECETMSRTLDVMLFPFRLAAYLGGALGLFGLVLAAVGLVGVAWSGVVQRTRELGIRASLGARPSRLLVDIVADGTLMLLAGIALGTLAAAPVALAMRGWLFGISPLDPLAFGVVCATILAVGLAAAVLPASRVVRLEPARWLREP